MALKFNNLAHTLFTAPETVEGTAVTPIATQVTLLTNFTFAEKITTKDNRFLGDALSRSADIAVTDHYVDMSGDLMMPSIGSASTTVADFLTTQLWNSAGMNLTYSGTGITATVVATNSVVQSTLLTAQYQQSTTESASQNIYQITDIRSTMDLAITVGEKATVKFNMQGNYNLPTFGTGLVANYGTQKQLTMPPILASNIVVCEITGDVGGFTHTGAAGSVKNICFEKISHSNASGFSHARFLNSCQSGFDTQAELSDFSMTVMDRDMVAPGSESATQYSPNNHIGDNHQFTLKYGTVQGSIVTIHYSELKLVDIGSSKIGNWDAKDLKFKSTGNITITFS